MEPQSISFRPSSVVGNGRVKGRPDINELFKMNDTDSTEDADFKSREIDLSDLAYICMHCSLHYSFVVVFN